MRLSLLAAAVAVGGVALVHPAAAASPTDRLVRDVVAGVGEQGEDDPLTPSPDDITAEPSIAANPDKPSNAVIAFKIGYGEAIGVATTFDAGRTWRSAVLPCTNRPTEAADGCGASGAAASTDPVVAFGRGGVVHVAFLDHGADSIDLSTSTDGGASWGNPLVAVGPTEPGDGRLISHDKEWMAVDVGTGPGHHPGRIFLVWAQETQSNPQATYSDDGTGWAPLADFPIGHGSDFQSFVLGDGSLGVFYDTGDTAAVGVPNAGVPSAPEQYMFVRATVGDVPGAALTLGNPIVVAPAMHRDESDQTTVLDVSTGAVDPASGRIYVAWADSTHTPAYNVIALATSDDEGTTWSAPVVAAQDPQGDLFHPALSAGKDGRVHLAWRDRAVSGGALQNSVATFAADSSDSGKTFGTPVLLSGSTTDVTYAQRPLFPASNGWFVGDYDEASTSGPLTYVARAEANAAPIETEFCPQAADAVQEGCMPAPHERVWVGVLGRH